MESTIIQIKGDFCLTCAKFIFNAVLLSFYSVFLFLVCFLMVQVCLSLP